MDKRGPVPVVSIYVGRLNFGPSAAINPVTAYNRLRLIATGSV